MTEAALQQWTDRLAAATGALGRAVVVDGMDLLGQRRTLDVEKEPATRVLRCSDGWVAVSLAREWDREAMQAWVGAGGTWEQVSVALADRKRTELIAGAELLGLAVGVLGERSGGAVTETSFPAEGGPPPHQVTRFDGPPPEAPLGATGSVESVDVAGSSGQGGVADSVGAVGSSGLSGSVESADVTGSGEDAGLSGLVESIGSGGSGESVELAGSSAYAVSSGSSGSAWPEGSVRSVGSAGSGSLRVLDLSALWAGPLCAALLAEAGAEVVKVESTARPDSSRDGNPGLFARLNGSKRSVVLDLGDPAGRADLEALVRAADVVVESSRPRALEQMGIVAAEVLADPNARPMVWVSITGHGRASNRVGFGDDAAVAGGLVSWDDGVPGLWGDAAADPLSGLVAATVAVEAVVARRCVLLDVALAGVAAELRSGLPATLPVSQADRSGPVGSMDRSQTPPPASALGADTTEVLAEWPGR